MRFLFLNFQEKFENDVVEMKTEMLLLLLRALFSLCLLLRFVSSEMIQPGSRLVVGDNSLWVSQNQDFALGFFTVPDLPNRFSIGIRFNSPSIPSDERRVVVWVAGAGVSVSDNRSYFELGHDGDLVLFDSSLGVPVWTSKTNRFSVSSALLRDDGNLVLLRGEKEVVWESFDTPADTLLPNQKLKAFEMLRAASESSRSSYYSLHMVESGRLELRWESSITFWSSGNKEAVKKQKIGAVLTPEGALSLVEETKPVWSVFGEDHNDTVKKFRFLRLDRDGNLRMYSFHEGSRTWRRVWQAVENQCRVFATCGSQVCSFNGSGSASSPQCSCPYNTFASASSTKCLTPYQKLSCKYGFSMARFENMELYGIYPANDSVVAPVSSRRCKEMCSDDLDCTAVTYKNPQCLVKLTRYVSGYSDPSLSSVSYVKTCLDPLPVDPPSKREAAVVTEKSRSVCLPCLISATTATFVLFLAFQVGVLVYMYRRKKKEAVKRAERFSKVRNNPKGVVVFSVDEIKEMTNDFEENIGPEMFKGVMMSENELVAVKEMEGTVTEERKFRSSAAKIGTMHHKNLAKLEGYCCERGKRFLVYEYAKNGSMLLDHFEKLTWRRRADTWLSVAKALFYLHSECREFVSHGSLNCGNVLLGDDFEAKLILYGFGSCAADKDVEDFGKMVLSLVTGRYEGGEVSEWVYREWIEGRGEDVVEARLEGEFDVEELERVLRICFWCVQVDERLRPSMGEVVKVLEGTLSVDPPPPPFVCVRSSPTNSSESGQSLYESVRE